MRRFVMGDIHGAYKAMEQCFERAGFDKNKDQLIQLGDIVDGYEDVFEVVELLLSIKNLIAIKGNHDDWFLSFIESEFHPCSWSYGGEATLHSYLNQVGKFGKLKNIGKGFKTGLQAKDIPLSHQALFKNQKLYYIDEENRCFVHAGFKRLVSFKSQNPENFYWDRTLFQEALGMDGYYEGGKAPKDFYLDAEFSNIFIGHTPTINFGTDLPIRALNVINLDTGAGHRGKLTLMELMSDGTEYTRLWQSDSLPSLYEKSYR